MIVTSAGLFDVGIAFTVFCMLRYRRTPAKETDRLFFKERVEWHGEHCEGGLLMVPVNGAFAWLRTVRTLDMAFLI
jgi:hypothetical protein